MGSRTDTAQEKNYPKTHSFSLKRCCMITSMKRNFRGHLGEARRGRKAGCPTPPHRSLHEVFPHKAPRLYSLPCRFASTGRPVQTFQLRDSRLCKGEIRQEAVERSPTIALPLTTSIQPCETVCLHRLIKAPQRLGVAMYPIILIMSLQFGIQRCQKPARFLVPMESYPFLHPVQRGSEFLSGCSPLHARRAFPVEKPVEFKP